MPLNACSGRNVELRLARALLCLALSLPACLWAASAAQGGEGGWPEGSAMEVGSRHVKTRDYFAGLLEKQQAALRELLGAGGDRRLLMALKDQHAEWLKYRVAECEVFGALTGAGGSWPSTYAVECEARLTEHRYHRVRAAAACLRKKPPDSRATEASRCLQQLLPLNL